MYIMRLILILFLSLFISTNVFAAGSDSSSNDSSSSEVSMYDAGVKLVKRAGKLEKKDKAGKAQKLYSQAFKKFEKA